MGEDSSISVDLSGGASITLSFKGNLFDLSAKERALVADLSNVIATFNGAKKEI